MKIIPSSKAMPALPVPLASIIFMASPTRAFIAPPPQPP